MELSWVGINPKMKPKPKPLPFIMLVEAKNIHHTGRKESFSLEFEYTPLSDSIRLYILKKIIEKFSEVD
jgi:hypothetical protein